MRIGTFQWLAACAAGIASFVSSAATVNWKAPVSGNWNDGSKWSAGSVPAVGDTVEINAAGTYSVTLNTTVNLAGLTVAPASGRATLVVANPLFLSGPSTVSSHGILQLTPAVFWTDRGR